MNKAFFYNKGFAYARFNYIAAWGNCRSWQRKAFKQGYASGRVYLQGEALLEGFNNVREYQKHIVKATIK